MIDRFRGNYAFLSNFYEVSVKYEGLVFPNSEAAFQSAKTLRSDFKECFCYCSPVEAKRAGRRIQLCEDWEQVRDQVMYDVVKAKFIQHEDSSGFKQAGAYYSKSRNKSPYAYLDGAYGFFN